MKFLPRIVAILGLLFLVACTAGTVQAADFDAVYEIDYTLQPDQNSTRVKQQITLTNLKPNLRANSYSLTLDSRYKNLSAYDSAGALEVKENKKDSSTTLSFTFNERVVGVGNSLTWTIEYDSESIGQRHGKVWDIAIPRVKEPESYNIKLYTARLHIPDSAGKKNYISPSPLTSLSADGMTTHTFSRDQIFPAGVVAAFGDYQLFDFTLKYHLHNPNLDQASTEIALPADIPGQQQIVYGSLTPQPVSYRTDSDGNTMAKYYLGPNESLDISFKGQSRNTARYPTLDSKSMLADIPEELAEKYTVAQKYWETSDGQLRKIAEEITDPQKPVVENARAIYDYVTSTLKYNTGRINEDLERLGAVQAIKEPDNAVCMEFTDLYIALARIAGIPAREIDGYAYTSDNSQPIYYPGLGSDILHAWVQVYLPEDGWIAIDPTWGSTTGGVDFFSRIDLNRIAFVVKGGSSESPYAAGSYKTNSEQDGDVSVSFSDTDLTTKHSIAMNLQDNTYTAGIGGSIPVEVENTGNVALYDFKLDMRHDSPVTLDRDKLPQPIQLLPGQKVTLWLPLGSESWFNHTDASISLLASAHDLQGNSLQDADDFSVNIQPFYLAVVMPVVLSILSVLGVTAASWYGLHFFHNRKNSNQPLQEQPIDTPKPI